MREIKFRAWDPVGRQMIYYPLWSTLHDKTVLVFAGKVDDYVDESDFNSQVQLMQFTGFKDEHGKEIYEGDVLHYYGKYKKALRARDINFSLIVTWEEDGKWNIAGAWDYSGEGFFDMYKCEIIGNVYENPELLDPRAKGE